jgi:hypothetical protein
VTLSSSGLSGRIQRDFASLVASPRAAQALFIAVLAQAMFVPFLLENGYFPLDAEVVSIAAATLCIGALAGALLAGLPLLRRLLAALMVGWIADFYFLELSSIALVITAGIFVGLSTRVEATLRWQLSAFALLFSLLMLASAGRPAVQMPEVSEPPRAGQPLKPPLVHIILDEHAAPNAVPPEAGIDAAVEAFNQDYLQRGFTLYAATRAVSGWSPLSLSAAMQLQGGQVSPQANVRKLGEERYGLLRNPYFEWLQEQGYRLDVIQSSYLDLCAGAVGHCQTYDPGEYGHAMHRFPERWLDRTLIPLIQINSLARASAGIHGVFLHRLLSGWAPGYVNQVSLAEPAAMLELLDRLEAHIATAPLRGRALVVHLLLPHFPWVLDEHCDLMPRARWLQPPWMLQQGAVAAEPGLYFEAHWQQSACAHRRALRIIDAILARGDAGDATILIHGDHGSKLHVWGGDPQAEQLSEALASESLDAHFAVRTPGLPPGFVESPQSLPDRLRSVLQATQPR